MAAVSPIDVHLQKMELRLRNSVALADDGPGLRRLQSEIDELADRVEVLEKRPPVILRSVGGGGGAAPAPVVVAPTPAAPRFAALVGDGTSTSISVTHGLGTLDVVVQVFDPSSGATVECGTARVDADTVNLEFTDAPLFNQYRVLIQA